MFSRPGKGIAKVQRREPTRVFGNRGRFVTWGGRTEQGSGCSGVCGQLIYRALNAKLGRLEDAIGSRNQRRNRGEGPH